MGGQGKSFRGDEQRLEQVRERGKGDTRTKVEVWLEPRVREGEQEEVAPWNSLGDWKPRRL